MVEADTIYEAIEVARKTGKIKKGTNEVTKAIERGNAKLVAVASDASPKEITMHLPVLCKEKGIVCSEVPAKEELGAAAGIGRGCAAVAVTEEGEAKKIIAELSKEAAPAKKAEEAPAEKAKEEPAEEKKKEAAEKPKQGE
jgi:large subunit ribosomal protein L7Ae